MGRGAHPTSPGCSALILYPEEDVQRGGLCQTFGDMPRRSQDAYDRFSAAAGLPMTVLALLWLPVLVIPFVVTLRPAVTSAFEAIDYFVWAAFVVEYLIKLWLAPARRTFVTHHLVDLAVIILPVLRPVRAARLLRVIALGRVGIVLANALQRAKELLTHRGLHYVLLSVGLVVFACAGLVLYFERNAPASNIHNIGDALWWAIVTVTTVGYGDRYPVTAVGRGVAVILMLVGIGLIGVLTATVASYFVEQQADKGNAALVERLERIEAMLAKLTDKDE